MCGATDMAERLRKPFAHAQDLMNRWDALQSDIRGTARQEQRAISYALDALQCPDNQSDLEWNIAMTIGMYTPSHGEPLAQYWTQEMEDERCRQIAEYERLNLSPPPAPISLEDDIPF